MGAPIVDDLDVENQVIAESGKALRFIGERLVLAAALRGRLGPADRAVFDAELAGILRRIVKALPVTFTALEGSVRP